MCLPPPISLFQDFVKPGCTIGRVSLIQLYWATLAIMAVAAVLMMIGAFIYATCRGDLLLLSLCLVLRVTSCSRFSGSQLCEPLIPLFDCCADHSLSDRRKSKAYDDSLTRELM
jgi:hypothetical protein